VVDTADRRRSLTGNLERYISLARTTIGAPEDALRRLFERHLDGAPPGEPPRVMHGVGFGRRARRRASLYFPTGWIPIDELGLRLQEQAAAVAIAHAYLRDSPLDIEVVGYDFTAGEVERWKTYTWLPLIGEADFAALASAYPGLACAWPLYESFAPTVPTALRERALFLQLSSRRGADPEAKLFFFGRAWGWASGAGLASVLGYVLRTFEVNPNFVLDLRDVVVQHHLPVMLGLLAVGGDARRPSLTFYFWPR
jgi:hypothetical protein